MRRCIPAQAAVMRSHCSMERSRPSLSRSRRPMTFKRMDCSTQRRVSVNRYCPNSRIKAVTSAAGRAQLAAEKAYMVKVSTPARAATSTTVRTAFAPSAWPAGRGRPRCGAQRPLPSMMIATCMRAGSALGAPRGFDHRLDMLEVAQQRLAADGGNAIDGLGSTRLERLRAFDVAGFLQLARVRSQVAVACVEKCLELIEGQLIIHRDSAHDAQPNPLVDQAIEPAIGIHARGIRDDGDRS